MLSLETKSKHSPCRYPEACINPSLRISPTLVWCIEWLLLESCRSWFFWRFACMKKFVHRHCRSDPIDWCHLIPMNLISSGMSKENINKLYIWFDRTNRNSQSRVTKIFAIAEYRSIFWMSMLIPCTKHFLRLVEHFDHPAWIERFFVGSMHHFVSQNGTSRLANSNWTKFYCDHSQNSIPKFSMSRWTNTRIREKLKETFEYIESYDFIGFSLQSTYKYIHEEEFLHKWLLSEFRYP